jgi:hypothetical protein
VRRPSNDLPEVYVCIRPVDFRKGIDGLTALAEGQRGQVLPFALRAGG